MYTLAYFAHRRDTPGCTFYGASVDGAYFSGLVISGDTQGWTDISLDLSDIPILGDLSGQLQVWVALAFSSNNSTAQAEGSYVDDIVLRKCLREPCSGESGDAEMPAREVRVEPAVRRLHCITPQNSTSRTR